ncbi:MAG: hypothetical protein HRT45_11170, partial [Bdellovibrionales bacterium]|nr:hypothetical protein [Bdellovibrionales bacterium]
MFKARLVVPFILALTCGLVLTVFQNCGSYKTRQTMLGPAFTKGNNGDGYSGIDQVFIYPKVTESGSSFSIESSEYILDGYEFELLHGTAILNSFPDGTGAF